MEKRSWGKTEIKTSLLGFGCMRLKTIDGRIYEEKGMEIIDKAYKNGVNYFDTAYPYTNKLNESFVGKALKRYERSSFYLASKFSLFCFNTKEEALKSIDIQLSNLQTEYIDFYLVHALNRNSYAKFKEWNMMETILKWKEEGKIRHIGFSFHDSYEVFEEILNDFDWEFVQIQLNYMDVDIQQGLKGYKLLEEKGIPCVVMEPIKGGRLSEFNAEISKKFKDYSDASLSSWALRWVGSLKGVNVILSGMNEMYQVDDNLNTFIDFKPLNEEEMRIIDDVRESLKKCVRVGCTGCRYCLPCPKGVDIPHMISIYNEYAMYKIKENALFSYNQAVKNNKDLSLCVECSLCNSKCPQDINPPQVFKDMTQEMEFLKK